MNLNQKMMQEMVKLNPVEVVGLARVLKVDLFEKKDAENVPRDFVDVFSDIMRAYDKKDRKFKRDLLKIVKQSGGKPDASNTENS